MSALVEFMMWMLRMLGHRCQDEGEEVGVGMPGTEGEAINSTQSRLGRAKP